MTPHSKCGLRFLRVLAVVFGFIDNDVYCRLAVSGTPYDKPRHKLGKWKM